MKTVKPIIEARLLPSDKIWYRIPLSGVLNARQQCRVSFGDYGAI